MGPKRMPGDVWVEREGNFVKLLRCRTAEESIGDVTTRQTVIAAMARVHREVIDAEKYVKHPSDCKQIEFLLLPYPDNHSSYDENMEVELKMENCVSIETLVKNVGQVLKGKFFLCRTITPSSRIIGVDAGVEDPEGKRAMRLGLFNYSLNAKMGKSDFEAVLPLGTMLIVKNPVFKQSFDHSPIHGLIVDNPGDVEILSPKRMTALFPGVQWKSDLPNESRVLLKKSLPFWEFSPAKSDLEIATKLKNVGNKAFIENRSTDAIRFYDVAAEYLPDDEEEITPAVSTLLVNILSNRAAALIKLECFNSALICTGKALGINNGHVKAIYRHAKALIGLGRYSEGGEFLDEKLTQFSSLGDDILRLRSTVPELLKPPGKEIIRALLSLRPMDCGHPQKDLPVGMVDRVPEFRGHVQLKKSKICNGEGLFATQDLEPGTIILVCKPFAGLYVNPQEEKAFRESTTTKQFLVGVMANKIWLDPLLGHDLYALWAGPELKTLTDNEDTKMTKVDIARIKKICNFNFTENVVDKEDYDDDEAEAEDFISCGVWIPVSKINHSCIDANVMFVHHDSTLVMMVTTFKKVKKGEEILMSYIDPFLPLEKRNFISQGAFICKCRLCELDRSESRALIAKRDRLIKSLAYDPDTNLYPSHPCLLARDLETIAEVESLRAASPDLNFAMTCPGIYTIAAVVLLDQRRYVECLSILEKIYAVVENVPTSCMHRAQAEIILICCMRMGKKKAVLEKWTEELRKYCRLYAGTLEHVRVGRYPTIPEDLKKFGIEFFNDTD
ncbi:uncharacterized protein LOC110857736 [Folsomia candida]|uniref:Serine/threonine-protein phosphatase 5 n=1 Tax=Folsomia candida TaxID=158441 RepID=A0A226DIX5_FOLCA|nr:uncharacterized protein LOC110857736 [Folsomia candida]XP_035714160.1 uncharacterized protein LOC110857736 [Folsomia candida]OXA44637.1 Serine/threonine-protein phosphatase 5 [Folsomia candida]